MNRLYDEHGTLLWGGRGRRSRECERHIREGTAFVMQDGALAPYSPPGKGREESRPVRIANDLEAMVKEVGARFGAGVRSVDVAVNVDGQSAVAHLDIDVPVVVGLRTEQEALLHQFMLNSLSRAGCSVADVEEMCASALPRMLSNMPERRPINHIPGQPTDACYDELWIDAHLPPANHPDRPSSHVTNGGVCGARDLDCNQGRETWESQHRSMWRMWVCENLEHAMNTSCFQNGAHKVIRVFLPEEHHLHEQVSPTCLERFLEACRSLVTSGTCTGLQVFIHEGDDVREVVF